MVLRYIPPSQLFINLYFHLFIVIKRYVLFIAAKNPVFMRGLRLITITLLQPKLPPSFAWREFFYLFLCYLKISGRRPSFIKSSPRTVPPPKPAERINFSFSFISNEIEPISLPIFTRISPLGATIIEFPP